MAPPYSTDFRWRIVWLKIVEEMSSNTIASLMNISERTVRRYIAKFHQTGDVLPVEHRNGPQPLLGQYEQIVFVHLLSENPSIYLHEVKQELENIFGVSVSISTVCKTMKLLGFTRKKIHHIALQRSDLLRAEFMATISVYDPVMLIWLDESGCTGETVLATMGDHRLLCRGK